MWLALQFNRTLDELLDTMTSAEYTQWIAYFTREHKQREQQRRQSAKAATTPTRATNVKAMQAALMKYAGAKGVKHDGDR